MVALAATAHVTRRRLVRLGLALAGLVIGVALCWAGASAVADAMGARDIQQVADARRQLAEQVAGAMANHITADVALLRAIPQTIAQIEAIPQAAARVDTQAIGGLGVGEFGGVGGGR